LQGQRRNYDAEKYIGVCKVNGVEKEFEVYDRTSDEVGVNIKDLDVEAMKAIGIKINYSAIVTEYQKQKAEKEKAKAKAKRIADETRYDNHPLQWYAKTHPAWSLNQSKEEYVTSTWKSLRLVQTVTHDNGAALEYKIEYNTRGQYELTANYDVVKRSKYGEKIEDAFNEHVRNRKNIIDTNIAETKQRIEKLKQVNIDLGLPITEVTTRHGSGHGRRYHSWESKKLRYTIVDAKYDSNKRFVDFTADAEKQTVKITTLKVDDLSYEQFKQIINIITK
jgi:hypothetical protein